MRHVDDVGFLQMRGVFRGWGTAQREVRGLADRRRVGLRWERRAKGGVEKKNFFFFFFFD